MYYVIIGKDCENSLALRLANRPAHLARLEQLNAMGRLLTAGPTPIADATDQPQQGFTGSVVIAQFDSLEAAQDWANADPYLLQGVYESVQVRPFIKVF